MVGNIGLGNMAAAFMAEGSKPTGALLCSLSALLIFITLLLLPLLAHDSTYSSVLSH